MRALAPDSGRTAVPAAGAVYDRIGVDYASRRRPDPRWAARIADAAPDARRWLNVGAGTGSYEPGGRVRAALEPSRTMIAQRPPEAAPAVRGVAEALPFRDGSFDVALAVLTVHHWRDPEAGLAQLRRAARVQVVVTWDRRRYAEGFWLLRDYLPEIGAREQPLATLDRIAAALAPCRVEPLPVPADCRDGFCGAYWKRPHAYLDPGVRAAISGLALLDAATVDAAMERLRLDLASRRWHTRNRELVALREIDLGYRLVVAPG